MTAHISQLIHDLLKTPERGPEQYCIMQAIAEELGTLDSRDFPPHARYLFVSMRARCRYAAGAVQLVNGILKTLEALPKVLDVYGGVGSHIQTRSFDFIADPGLKAIVIRDYRELDCILFPSHAWKSTVIMAGSILEAILYDLLVSDRKINARACAAPSAPKKLSLDRAEWKLCHLIDVASEIELLPPSRAASIDQVLRDYRNFVHPNKEIKSEHQCTEAEALMAKGALDGVCNHLSK